MFCYVGGGWYWPGQTIKDLQDEMRRHRDAGYTMVKMKVGGLPLAEDLQRVEAVLANRARTIAVFANMTELLLGLRSHLAGVQAHLGRLGAPGKSAGCPATCPTVKPSHSEKSPPIGHFGGAGGRR